MTLLLQMENALNVGDGKLPEEKKYLLEHITLIFRVLTLSMRYEPSNARYFLLEASVLSCTHLRSSFFVEPKNYFR